MKIALVTNLTPEECLERLRSSIDDTWENMAGSGDKPVVGTVRGNRFRLRKRIWYSNSFQEMMTGQVERYGPRTRVHTLSGMHPFVLVFCLVFFAPILFGIGSWLYREMLNGSYQVWHIGTLATSIGVPLLFATPILVGRFLARGERAFLVAFLEKTLDASVHPDESGFPWLLWFYPLRFGSLDQSHLAE